MRPESVGGFIVLEPTDCNFHTAEIIIGYCGGLGHGWLGGTTQYIQSTNARQAFLWQNSTQKRQLSSVIVGGWAGRSIQFEFRSFQNNDGFFFYLLRGFSLEFFIIVPPKKLATYMYLYNSGHSAVVSFMLFYEWPRNNEGSTSVAGCRILLLKSIVTHPPPVLAWRRVIIIPKLMSSTHNEPIYFVW